MDQVRQRTKRRIPLRTCELIEELNPLLRGWGEYYNLDYAHEPPFRALASLG
jgi:Group II intron, maturase-specific domain